MSADPNHLDDLVEAAHRMPEHARSAFLDGACGTDTALRAEIERRLGQIDLKDISDTTLISGTQPDRAGSTGPAPGEMIDQYRLLSVLGQGGFGVVFLAEQEKPIQRRVALKVIRSGLDSSEVIARFAVERQALALMEHPGIAKVFDAGVTTGGQPYLVMELVQGAAITEACDRQRLGIRDRVALMAKVCDAIQHAHYKGIVHRDLKPSNILVYLDRSGVLQPKVIDFGVAKAASGQLASMAQLTQAGQFIGTPAYMSPEQADLSELGTDTRTDIYSLGAILYELLCGAPPFDPDELCRSGLTEMRRIICDQRPQRPSRRLSQLEEDLALRVMSGRSTERERLLKSLQKEVEWIPLKALKKAQAERYESARAMAADLRAYLDGNCLIAGPDSGWYRIRKWARRHQAAVLMAVASTILMLGWGTVATILWNAAKDSAAAAQQKTEQVEMELNRRAELYDFLRWQHPQNVTREVLGQHRFYTSGVDFYMQVERAVQASEVDLVLQLEIMDLLLRSPVGKRFTDPRTSLLIRAALDQAAAGASNNHLALARLALAAALLSEGKAEIAEVQAAYDSISAHEPSVKAIGLSELARAQLWLRPGDMLDVEAIWHAGRENAQRAIEQLAELEDHEEFELSTHRTLIWHHMFRAGDDATALEIYEQSVLPLCDRIFQPGDPRLLEIEMGYLTTWLLHQQDLSEYTPIGETFLERLGDADDTLNELLEIYGSTHNAAWRWMHNLALVHAALANDPTLSDEHVEKHQSRAASLWREVLIEAVPRHRASGAGDHLFYLQQFRRHMPHHAPNEEAWDDWITGFEALLVSEEADSETDQ